MIFERVSNNPYSIVVKSTKVDSVANNEKIFPLEWINEARNGIKDCAIEYFLPLIQGEVMPIMKNGIPVRNNFV